MTPGEQTADILHWRLDVIFGEDASRSRKDMSPLN